VSPRGDDDAGDGSREYPYATLEAAVEAAVSEGKRVYACATEGAFEEPLVLSATEDGIQLFGRLDCADWSVDAELSAPVAPESGLALIIEGMSEGVTLDGFSFESADATELGESSVAGLVRSSQNVTLRGVSLTAGDGAAGADGATVPVEFPDKETELDGNDGPLGSNATPGAGGVVECAAGGTSEGGVGGTSYPSSPGAGLPNYDGPGGEAGLTLPELESVCDLGLGSNGADAPASEPGSGASSYGRLVSGGWAPAAGMPGDPGLPGQGGGGGAGSALGAGAGGGAGSCGGAGGAPGQGGGASIALLLDSAPVTLIDTELVTGNAGDGGAGDEGQQGQLEGGDGGLGSLGSCAGGAGGLGGDGGAGGGGAGGISVGVVVVGDAPTLTDTVITTGSAGDSGVGGEPGGNDGIDGVSEEQLVL
jgi:hypothetical protein